MKTQEVSGRSAGEAGCKGCLPCLFSLLPKGSLCKRREMGARGLLVEVAKGAGQWMHGTGSRWGLHVYPTNAGQGRCVCRMASNSGPERGANCGALIGPE